MSHSLRRFNFTDCVSQCFFIHLLCVSYVVYMMLLKSLMLTIAESRRGARHPSSPWILPASLQLINHVSKVLERASRWEVMVSAALVPSVTERPPHCQSPQVSRFFPVFLVFSPLAPRDAPVPPLLHSLTCCTICGPIVALRASYGYF